MPDTRQPDATRAAQPIKDHQYWTPHSTYTRRQDAIGDCAENNGGTSRCNPGMCSLCEHCSFNETKPS